MSHGKPRNGRVVFLKLFFLLFAFVIVGRHVQLQVAADPRLARLAKRQFSAKVTSLPRRGLIFDRNGEGLAISLKVRSLFFRPELLRKDLTQAERNHLLYNLARVLHQNVNGLFAKAKSEKGFVWVKRQLSQEEEKAVRESGVLEFGDGVGLVEESKRFYPNKDLAAHVLGSVGVDGQGLEGLELFYEQMLTGESTRLSSSRDARGRKIFRDDRGLAAFRDGQSLVLTLDTSIQYEAEKALKDSVDNQRARAGSIIVADVESGEILAMANYPTFNPNNPKGASPDSRRNRAITDSYEPGSTFKPLMVAAALEKGKTPKSRIYCERGSFIVGDRRISEAETHEKFEWLTLGEVLKFSSNVGAAKIALELGAANVSQLADRLGAGRKTGVDLPGEASGSFNIKELRSSVRLANVGFGHGFTVTPLQMLSYYLTLANGGHWIQPKLVKAVLSEDPDSLERGAIRWRLGQRFDNPKTRRVFSTTVASQVTAMLETVVEDKGTGVKARLDDWTVAGKTGTSQKVDPETRRYSRSKYIASFAGFAPSRKPKLVAIVVIDEPQKSYYASEAAAPVFREAMRAGLMRERVPGHDEETKGVRIANQVTVSQLQAEALSATQKISAATEEQISATGQATPPEPLPTRPEYNERSQVRLPDLKGLTVREAMRAIGNQPLRIEINGSGLLREQIPPPAQWLDSGAKVRLIFQSVE